MRGRSPRSVLAGSWQGLAAGVEVLRCYAGRNGGSNTKPSSCPAGAQSCLCLVLLMTSVCGAMTASIETSFKSFAHLSLNFRTLKDKSEGLMLRFQPLQVTWGCLQVLKYQHQPNLVSCVQSSASVEFWKELASLKLNTLRLSEELVDVQGVFSAHSKLKTQQVGLQFPNASSVAGTLATGNYEEVCSPLQLDAGSFSTPSCPQVRLQAALCSQACAQTFDLPIMQGAVAVPGQLTNFNTLEQFKGMDRPAALQTTADANWAAICSGAAERDPALLWRFAAFSFADLKKFSFLYW